MPIGGRKVDMSHTFLVGSYYRGNLNVDSMRLFETEESARRYVREQEWCGFRVYAVNKNAPPKLIWTETMRSKGGEIYDWSLDRWIKLP